ncbi:hypothetical protein ACGFRB_29440 [Streptomyces sp. NPDC048718]|uniref:hypothetical protein n=1 Tax=Streptomyces sp. NPDC048718 TaxID=3365587 RepID=UPI00371BD77E
MASCDGSDDWEVVCTELPLTLRHLASLTWQDAFDAALLPAPLGDRLPAGAWLPPPELPLRPRRALAPLAPPRTPAEVDSSRVEGPGHRNPAGHPAPGAEPARVRPRRGAWRAYSTPGPRRAGQVLPAPAKARGRKGSSYALSR